MTMDHLKQLVDDVPELGIPTTTGSVSGLYQVYSKYHDEEVWGFTQSYMTKQGVSHLLTNVNEDVLERVDIMLLFTDAQKKSTVEIFNTMENVNYEKASAN